MALTRSWVVRVTGGTDVLGNKPVLQRAVKMRSPYVDALSLLQLRALRALRDADARPSTRAAAPAAASVSGVAAGLRTPADTRVALLGRSTRDPCAHPARSR